MPYLVYAGHSAASDRSRREAEARGCDPAGTTHWWAVVEGPDDAAVIVTDADDPPLSAGPDPVADPPEWYVELLAQRQAALPPT